MARPRTISDDLILEAARRVFIRDGVAASTSAVAREAGVSEGTIFKRFTTKDELFQRSMAVCEAEWTLELEPRVGQGELREQLEAVALELLGHLRRVLPRIMALTAHGSFDARDFWRENPHAAPVEGLKRLTNYLDAEMRLGRLRLGDPEIMARILLGSVQNYVFFEFVGAHARMPMAAPTYVRGLVATLWGGLRPDQS